MNLTNEQYEELTQAICHAFDHDSLEQMVQFKLGKELYALVAKDEGLQTISFELIKEAEKDGWTEALVRAVYISRPNNAKVKDFVERHWPQAKVTLEAGQQIEAVKVGLNALTSIVQRLADPTIREIIGGFRADFEMTHEKIQTLGQYKGLHDQLHQLNAKYLRSMTSAAGLWRQDELQLQLLESYAVQLRGDAGRVRPVAQRLRSYRVEKDWIDALEQAASLVQEGIDRTNDASLARGLLMLRRVLVEEPVRINALVCDTAGDLRLDQITQAMKEIAVQLRRITAGNDGNLPRREFQEGLDGMLYLRPRLIGLVEEHFEWQWLDKEFTAADTSPGMTPDERFPRWPSFQTRLLGLCDLSADKEWSKTLTTLLRELQEAGATQNAVQFGRRYNKFRTVAADRFFNVDAELFDLSGHLAELAEPLNHLLRILTDGPR